MIDAGSVSLIVGAAVAIITVGTTSLVKVLTLIRSTSSITGGKLDGIRHQVNGTAAAAAEKLTGLEREAMVLRELVASQRIAIDGLTSRVAALLAVIDRKAGS